MPARVVRAVVEAWQVELCQLLGLPSLLLLTWCSCVTCALLSVSWYHLPFLTLAQYLTLPAALSLSLSLSFYVSLYCCASFYSCCLAFWLLSIHCQQVSELGTRQPTKWAIGVPEYTRKKETERKGGERERERGVCVWCVVWLFLLEIININ